jgi:lysyl-tRNA synthetase class 2
MSDPTTTTQNLTNPLIIEEHFKKITADKKDPKDKKTRVETKAVHIEDTKSIPETKGPEDSNQTNEESYYTTRQNELVQMKNNNINPYPHKFQPTISVKECIEQYNYIEKNVRLDDKFESMAGRIISIRNMGKKIFFYTIQSDGHLFQYLAMIKDYESEAEFYKITSQIKRGDIVGATGIIYKSKTGELSLVPKNMIVLTPCLKLLPSSHFGVKDEDLRVKKRYLDLIINPESRNKFIVRNKIIKQIRKYLDDMDFVEVQTPILCNQAGGASACPFVTYSNDLKQDLYLRIAPELYLKQLVVGGIDRVYELGAQFRNETSDLTHDVQFTSLEYYQAYADYLDLMHTTESMIPAIVKNICGSYIVNYRPLHSDKDVQINFEPPFRRIDILTELQAQTKTVFPQDLSTESAREFLIDLCTKFNVECADPKTTARLLDKLIGHFIEPQCTNPTFVCNHPIIMSPLAKQHRDNLQLTERFELFVCGLELANAYTELNDPIVQRERFVDQLKAIEMGDVESQRIDNNFCESLDYGLCPTGGFGMGIDRFIMFLTNSNKIKDVILFPTIVKSVSDL